MPHRQQSRARPPLLLQFLDTECLRSIREAELAFICVRLANHVYPHSQVVWAGFLNFKKILLIAQDLRK